jgi:Na+/proline symporter
MFPDFSRGLTGEALWTLPVLTFLVHLGVQWWAFWYPGAEPGGGGYIAQRIFSARDERHGLLSVLWFNIAHYAVRPWPWILTALAAAALYPGLQHPETGYMLVATTYVPHALRGILIAGFMAAFMSTIATQLNWGSSYLVEDFYRRFVRRTATEKHYVNVSRIATLLLVAASAYVSAQLVTIGQGWEAVLEVGAGTGGVYLLRWYWWRINAWSEISAMATALVMTLILHHWQIFGGSTPVIFAKTTLTTTAVTTAVWIAVTFLTPPEPQEILLPFYRKVRPHAAGWRHIAALAPDVPETRDLGKNLLAWALGCAMVYAALFGIGKICLGAPGAGMLLLALSAACAAFLYRDISRRVTIEPMGGSVV